jgi:hypothetical protein
MATRFRTETRRFPPEGALGLHLLCEEAPADQHVRHGLEAHEAELGAGQRVRAGGGHQVGGGRHRVGGGHQVGGGRHRVGRRGRTTRQRRRRVGRRTRRHLPWQHTRRRVSGSQAGREEGSRRGGGASRSRFSVLRSVTFSSVPHQAVSAGAKRKRGGEQERRRSLSVSLLSPPLSHLLLISPPRCLDPPRSSPPLRSSVRGASASLARGFACRLSPPPHALNTAYC